MKLEFNATLIRAPLAKRSDEWRDTAYKWRLTILNHANAASMELDYYMGSGLGRRPPTLADVMGNLLMGATSVDNADGFEDWASELGFDPDSRKAERIYNECVEQSEKLKEMLGEDYQRLAELDEEQLMQELAE